MGAAARVGRGSGGRRSGSGSHAHRCHRVARSGLWARAHLVHGDVKSTNFIISEDKPVLIDLDAMRLHKSQRSLERGVKKDRLRFRENWINDPEPKAMFELLMNADWE